MSNFINMQIQNIVTRKKTLTLWFFMHSQRALQLFFSSLVFNKLSVTLLWKKGKKCSYQFFVCQGGLCKDTKISVLILICLKATNSQEEIAVQQTLEKHRKSFYMDSNRSLSKEASESLCVHRTRDTCGFANALQQFFDLYVEHYKFLI